MRHPFRALLVLGVLPFAACGKRGDPLPPFPRTPQAITNFNVAQRGDVLEATGVAPRVTTAGQPLQVFEVELLWAEGPGSTPPPTGTPTPTATPPGALAPKGLPPAAAGGPPPPPTSAAAAEIEKNGQRSRIRVAPGETFAHTWPLPPAGTTVRFTARAVNRGQRSVFAPAVTFAVQALPPAPTALKASLEAGAVVLEWTGGPARVYRKGKTGQYAAPLDPKPTAAASYRDTAVAANDSWCYVVRAVTGSDPLVESPPSTEACVSVRDVFAPAAPTGVAALAAGGVVDVSWSPSTEADLAGYRVYRAENEGVRTKVGDAPAGETRFRDEKVTLGSSYTYTVTAVDKDGNESGHSKAARARLL
jgi:hypothetical protein